jgi:hypothetical protein
MYVIVGDFRRHSQELVTVESWGTCSTSGKGTCLTTLQIKSFKSVEEIGGHTMQAYVAAWRARFRQDGWHPSQWAGCCDGVNGTLLEVFVTDTRQQALAAYEGEAP